MSKNQNPGAVVMDEDPRAARVLAHPIAWVPALIGGILILFNPNALAGNGLILMLAEFSAACTRINEFVLNSSFPSSALPFYAIVFSAFPVQLVLLWVKCKQYAVPEVFVRNASRLPCVKRLAFIALAPLGVAVGYFAVFLLPSDPSFCIGCTSGSKIVIIVMTASGILVEIFLCLSMFMLSVNARNILFLGPR